MTHYKREMSVAAAYVLLLLILAWRAPGFYEGNEFRSILVANAPVLVMAVGMTLVILSRHIDISIGSQFAVCGVAAALQAKAGWPMPLVALGTVVLGAVLGLANGVLVGGLGLPSIVVTLASMALLREGLSWARHGAAVGDLPADFQWFGFGQEAGRWLIVGVAAAVFLVFAWGLRFLAAGRAVYATGSDPDAAWLVGIRPRRVVVGAFALMGGLTGLAALLNAVRFRLVYPDAGTGVEIQVIAAVVVGGVAIAGGRGNLFGPLLGVLLFGTIGSALIFLGSQINQQEGGTNLHHWEKAIQGGIILIVVAFEGLQLRRRKDATTYLVTS